jgi:hypothetical protein
VTDKAAAGQAESQEILQARTQAWWLTVLAGQVTDTHPVQGTRLKARMEGNTLVLSGTVSSEADSREIEAEVEHLRAQGVMEVRNELKVAEEEQDQKGLLTQTLLATFATAEQAGFAEGYLEGHAHIRPGLVKVIGPETGAAGPEALHAILPQPYWQDAEAALAAQRALLIATVDETDAFKTRELLDEETPSLETVVLPPEPPYTMGRTQSALRQAPQSGDSRRVDEEAEAGRDAALRREDAIHGT